MKSKKIILLGVNRHAISINDFFMFFSRTNHEIVHIFFPKGKTKNKNWWFDGKRKDAARDNSVDYIDKSKYSITYWENINTVINKIESIDFDYICMGNGTDKDQLELISRVGIDKILFSEYGWLPWSKNFYISRMGCGYDSEITKLTEKDISKVDIIESELESLKLSYDKGNDLLYNNFYYVPLQKDVNDFKFTFTDFKSNQEFIDHIHNIVPNEYSILIKCHPLYKKKYNLPPRFIDITDLNINKHSIYSKMKGMICINSTSILESILFSKKTFVYGKDLFLNKNLVSFNIRGMDEFKIEASQNPNPDICKRFISLLISRQVDRKKCTSNDYSYVDNHYWNNNI